MARILGTVQLVPFVLGEKIQHGRRDDAFEEQSGENDRRDGLEAL